MRTSNEFGKSATIFLWFFLNDFKKRHRWIPILNMWIWIWRFELTTERCRYYFHSEEFNFFYIFSLWKNIDSIKERSGIMLKLITIQSCGKYISSSIHYDCKLISKRRNSILMENNCCYSSPIYPQLSIKFGLS